MPSSLLLPLPSLVLFFPVPLFVSGSTGGGCCRPLLWLFTHNTGLHYIFHPDPSYRFSLSLQLGHLICTLCSLLTSSLALSPAAPRAGHLLLHPRVLASASCQGLLPQAALLGSDTHRSPLWPAGLAFALLCPGLAHFQVQLSHWSGRLNSWLLFCGTQSRSAAPLAFPTSPGHL